MALELIVYKPIVSLYSNFFSTDLVLRLWDLIFFWFGAKEQADRKRGLWYVMAPAYLVLKKLQKQIVQAYNAKAIILLFSGGSTLWYDPVEFIRELNEVCEEVFVE